MAGVQIRVDEGNASATLSRVIGVAQNPAAVMSAIAGYLVTSTQRHFEKEKGPTGRWPALSPRTAEKRIGKRRRGTANMLRVSGRLYSSIVGESDQTEARVGTNVVYAAIHQFGGAIDMHARSQQAHFSTGKGRKKFVKASAKRKTSRWITIGAHQVKIPARPFLYLDDQDAKEIEQIAEDAFRAEAAQP